ncbi:hypothetical protein [Scytonema sp. HK-05]|uniref:hypothetical protein n=1 Tax=Scytonema sp. HK-05 TaxID=1137095 RepID=UPI0013011990|nr:hypothetical protein [Scytonema sp. HK-05]
MLILPLPSPVSRRLFLTIPALRIRQPEIQDGILVEQPNLVTIASTAEFGHEPAKIN